LPRRNRAGLRKERLEGLRARSWGQRLGSYASADKMMLRMTEEPNETRQPTPGERAAVFAREFGPGLRLTFRCVFRQTACVEIEMDCTLQSNSS
jgi:hypothetical protein